jgi:galactonate dehydratase
MSTDVAALLEVARAQPVRIAAGERMSEGFSFAELLHARVIDIIQPEVLHCGGVGGLSGLASMAAAYGAWIAPHNAQSPFTTVVNAHVGLSSPALLIQETFDDFLEPWSKDIISDRCRITDGYLELPDGPGFGVSFDPDQMARYPYSPQNFLRLFSSGWEQRKGDR